jgi:hypothetical protein
VADEESLGGTREVNFRYTALTTRFPRHGDNDDARFDWEVSKVAGDAPWGNCRSSADVHLWKFSVPKFFHSEFSKKRTFPFKEME